jgi:sigma-B regulation protein RsbU (phosphoserine phosphatase)
MWRPDRSLAGRLALLIVLGAGLVLLTVLFLSHCSFRRLFVQQVHERSATLTRSAVNRIDSRMGRAEAALLEAAVAFALLPQERESAENLLRATLERQSDLCGMTIALAPGDEARRDYRLLSSWKKDRTVVVATDDRPDKSYQQDWFYLPFFLQRPVWTEPYYDDEAGETMVTFAVPVLEEGKVEAVIAGDVSLEWIRRMLNDLPLGPGGQAILLSRLGRYISHPERRLEMRETVFSLAESLATPEARTALTDLGRRMLQGASGQVSYRRPLDQKPAFLHYRPVPSSGWVLGVVIPEQQIHSATARVNRVNGLAGLVGTALLLAAALGVGWSVARPLKKLAGAADRLARGDFEAPLPAIRSRDEVGRLNESFGRMRVDLRRYIEQLTATTAAKEKIASELAIAREIQLGIVPKLFPPFPNRPDLDLYARLVPALEVGGDFYDFALLDEDHLYVAIGDVSGKGVPASLLMAVGKTLLKTVMQTVRDPAQALCQVNEELAEDNDSCMFITVFCGMINLRSGDLLYANAGHNPPLLVSPDNHLRVLDTPPGPALGALPGSTYQSRSLRMSGADLLLLYTDGVTEAMDTENNLFGDRRLHDLVRRQQDLSAHALITAVEGAVQQHGAGAGQSDDITLLAVRHDPGEGQPPDPPAADAGQEPVAVLQLANRLDEVPRLAAWVEDLAGRLELSPQATMNLNLALEEWVVNVISYAYEDEREHAILLRLWTQKRQVRIEVEDDGRPFDPTARGDVDTDAALEHRPVGGLGIHFIRKTMAGFDYRREHDRNIVTLSVMRGEEPKGKKDSC